LKEKKARIETLEQNVTALEKLKIEERLIKLETKVAGIIRNASVAAYCDFGVNLDDGKFFLFSCPNYHLLIILNFVTHNFSSS